jgi:release factor glutamine methyltransferase
MSRGRTTWPRRSSGVRRLRARLAELLSSRGFIAADDEARELITAANGDATVLCAMVERRLTGEPLAWITGAVEFCRLRIRVDPGVYVPRWHSAQLARRAVARLPYSGTAVDLCTGSGAIAKVMANALPAARVVATDLDESAVTCARGNGVEAYQGDLFEPLPAKLEGTVDVVVAVVPYVPSEELRLLQRDTFTFESTLSYDGGADGGKLLRRVIAAAPRFLKPGGALLLELGGEQADLLDEDLERAGFDQVEVLRDDEGDARGLEALRPPR